MSKTAKTVSLIAAILLGSAIVFHLFNAPSTPIATKGNGEVPWYVTIFISWAPSLTIIVLYAVFLRIMKKILLQLERIAAALERNDNLLQRTQDSKSSD